MPLSGKTKARVARLSLFGVPTLIAVVAATGALVFACSSSSSPAPLTTGNGSGSGLPLNEGEVVQPISPQEQAPYNADEVCASQCFVDFPSGATLLQTLDDCNSDQCYADDADDNTTEKSCSAIGTGRGQISYGLPERDRCLARSCCAEAQACSANAACTSLASCIDRCQVKL